MKKYTVIYVVSWMSGCHMQHITRMKRCIKQPNETCYDMLTREGLEDVSVFLFEGHPKLEGEQENAGDSE